MPQQLEQLVGRDDAISLIHDLTDRPLVNGRRRSQPRPVLVLEGARGSGKSALLGVLRRYLDQNVPFAALDLERERSDSIPEVLSALAFQLSRTCPDYGAIRFGRFTLARLMMTRPVSTTDWATARREVQSILETRRGLDGIRRILAETAGRQGQHLLDLPAEAADATGTVVEGLTRRALEGLTRWAPARRIVLGSYLAWFGHRDRKLPGDPIDVLVELNRFAQAPAEDEHREWIHELLWDAFLTDLSEHFDHNRRARSLEFDCVILLDNADTRLGRGFVSGLVQARSDRPERAEPLLAVVTSRGDLLVDVPSGDLIEFVPDQPVTASPHSPKARLRLPDLTIAQARTMVTGLGIRGGSSTRSTLMLHQFTSGHPASTQLLASCLGRHPAHRDSLVTLLEQAEPGLGSNRLRVADRMQEQLVASLSPTLIEDLETCSAALDEHHARTLIPLLSGGRGSFDAVAPMLWPRAGGAGPRVLRRLLLRHLADRNALQSADQLTELPSWEATFDRLRQARALAAEPAGELYYALAGGEFRLVIDRLSDALTTSSPQRWRELLLRVTQAPRRHPGPAVSPDEEMKRLLREHPFPGRTELARLVIAHWILADPLTDGRRSGLYLQMAAGYEAVARSCGQDDVEPFLRAARNSLIQSEQWD
ncbi:MAG TPA: hypothetical protein VLL08_20410 [Kineosporiaceae bacterium]|nr:hypothetical protein [Kineosporiaceae bacterium]